MSKTTPFLLLSSLILSSCVTTTRDEISITETTHLDRPHYKIETPDATYLYDPIAGGFSSIMDPTGADWVAYRDQPWGEYPASAASSFRGLPNLVFGGEDDGAGHPGHKKCQSSIVSENQIQSHSLSGKWSWTWTFYESHAELNVEKTDPDRAYWFLYEGPPGGAWDSENTIWGSNLGGPLSDHPDFYQGGTPFDHFHWIYFGTTSSSHTFWIGQAESDELFDLYALLGNQKKGIPSENGMAVAGFGRGPNTTPLLKGPNRFKIGIHPHPIRSTDDHQQLANTINTLLDSTSP